MDEESFLPDGKPVIAHALASVQYRRDDFRKIAEGADPVSFPMPSNIEPMWGLIYTCADGIGFFVHPTEAPLAILFRTQKNETPKAMHLEIPYSSITGAEIKRPREPKTTLGKFLRKYSSKPAAEFTVKWRNGDREAALFFFLSTNADAFIESFGIARKAN